MEPTLANNLNRASRNRHLCFEVYGFDVLLDKELKPWLLEVNVLPSLSSSSALDKKIKTSLMTDVFSTIGVTPYSQKRLEKLQESSKWKRFTGLMKQANASGKHVGAHILGNNGKMASKSPAATRSPKPPKTNCDLFVPPALSM